MPCCDITSGPIWPPCVASTQAKRDSSTLQIGIGIIAQIYLLQLKFKLNKSLDRNLSYWQHKQSVTAARYKLKLEPLLKSTCCN